jgi:hypothetical protein
LTNEKKLIQHIRENYPVKWGRPVRNTSETLFISIGITLVQILDLVENLLLIINFIYISYYLSGCKQPKLSDGNIYKVSFLFFYPF